MKQAVSPELRRQVLELRRRHSIATVAKLTGLPVGTVKTLVSRSGAFRDNPTHRALFTLPPIRPSKQTLPAVPELPPKQRVTGDDEIDAVLWLRAIINTGNPALIEKALQAKERIKSSSNELEDRYVKHMVSQNPGNWVVGLTSIGFANLDGLATSVIERERRRTEASARFDDILALTDAEVFCESALDGLEPDRMGFYKGVEASERFRLHTEVMPNTLADCLYELAYWDHLYDLRYAVEPVDSPHEAYARQSFTFTLLAEIRPRCREEAIAVFRYMADENKMDRSETEAILGNLIGDIEAKS